MNLNPEELKWLILNSAEPLLFKNVLNSKLISWSLDDWNHVLKNKELEFRSGVFEHTKEPQWERKTRFFKETFEYFLKHTKSETKNWLYFDYKYLKEWLTDIKDLRDNIDWASLGFPNITVDDCTLWIGSKGAHTPCHIDTYGFNLIFQVYGRKQWIVAPPEENLQPTRIPYEESSIYSKLNFFSPTDNEYKGVNNCRKIVLNPGEVLFLPNKWWHYVENLETAISINVWIPLPQDDAERLKESIIQLFIKQVTEVSNKETIDHILNPNMEQNVLHSDINSLFEIINTCKSVCKEQFQNNKKLKKEVCALGEITENIPEKILDKYSFIERIPKLTRDQLNLFLREQSIRFSKNERVEQENNIENNMLDFFNIFMDQDVVSLISEKLLGTKI